MSLINKNNVLNSESLSNTNEDKSNNKINKAIDEYYKLKNNYENNFYDQYVKPIIKQKELSLKEKKSKYKKLPKPKCINCKRNVGSIFNIKGNDKYTNHVYKAYCGDIINPCPFNINITMSNVQLIDNILLENESSIGSINISKINIIKAKNDLLFGYLKEDTAFKLFEDLTNELESETKTYEYFLEKFIQNYDNVEKKEKLKKLKVELGLNIQQFKLMISEFNKTNNSQIVYNAIEMFINEIEPKLKSIEEISYAYNKIEYNENDDTYLLIQKKYSIEQMEMPFDTSKIESFIIRKLNDKNNTLKNSKVTTKTLKTKTRKQKPILIEEDVGEINIIDNNIKESVDEYKTEFEEDDEVEKVKVEDEEAEDDDAEDDEAEDGKEEDDKEEDEKDIQEKI